ncbi:MAG: lactonase family protein [Marmoricola sp.]
MKKAKLILRAGPALVAAAVTVAFVPAAHAQRGEHGSASAGAAVYTETNAPSGNALEVFYRDPAGELRPGGSYATGGTGTGTGLGSGHSVVASRSGRTVLAVNAGSNSVSAFTVGPGGLRQLGGATPSGGATPTSVTIARGLVYVLNAGDGTISGFRLEKGTGLVAIPGSTQRLAASGTSTDSQIQFDRTGNVLIVDERGDANELQTFTVGEDGVARPGQTVASDAGAPYGFDVDRAGHVLFSNAAFGDSSGASSYDVSQRGTLSANGGPVSTGQAAACWLASVGRYAYTANAGSGSISTLSVAPDGSLAVTGTTPISADAHPLDMAGAKGRFLYVVAHGTDEIIGYRVGAGGSLSQITRVSAPGATGLGAH